MKYLRAFAAGFISTLTFHQGALAALHSAGIIPRAPYPMAPTHPFGVPAVISLAFFGGLWGILIWWAVAKKAARTQLILSIIFGAVGPTLVAIFVVFPLKGMPIQLGILPMGLLLNGLWGLGLWVFMRFPKSA